MLTSVDIDGSGRSDIQYDTLNRPQPMSEWRCGRLTTMMLAALLMAGIALVAERAPTVAAQPAAGGEHWIATWGTALQLVRLPSGAGGRGAPPPAAGVINPAPAAPSIPTAPSAGNPPAPVTSAPARKFAAPIEIAGISDQTIRMIVRASVRGRRVRIRLTNAFGAATVSIGAAHIALRQAESSIVAGSDRALTFGGQPAALVYAGQVLFSDPVDLEFPPLTDLAVSLYIAGDAGTPTAHRFGLRPTYVSQSGNQAGAASIENLGMTTESYYWLAGVDVLAPAEFGTLVTFGDSITDGDQSTPDTNRMWPAVLATRLQANAATRHIGVVNAGIAGNRLLGDNNSGIVRFIHHALGVPGVKWITVLEGINDISAGTRRSAAGSSAPPTFSAGDLIRAYRQLIDLAHLHGLKVIGCTLTPFGGSSAGNDRGEEIRTATNDWIRTGGAFDAIVDFDAATRDRTDPRRFRAEAESPDLLHPGDGGYRLMADAFNLGLFAGSSRTRQH